MSYRTIAHHARSVRLTTSDGVFWLGSREQALPLQKVLISPKGVTTTDLCEVAESEGHAIGVAGVVIVGIARVVHIAEVSRVVAIRRTLPPVVRRTGKVLQDLTHIRKTNQEGLCTFSDQISSRWKLAWLHLRYILRTPE